MRKEDSIRVGRIVRVFNEFVRPARRGDRSGLDVAAYHVHGEPVPLEVALAADFEPFAVGAGLGPGLGHHLVPAAGHDPGRVAGPGGGLGFAIGNAGTTGFGAESLVWRDGRPVQGLSPNHREYLLTRQAERWRAGRALRGGGSQPPSPFGANPWPLLMPEPDGAPLFTLATGRPPRP